MTGQFSYSNYWGEINVDGTLGPISGTRMEALVSGSWDSIVRVTKLSNWTVTKSISTGETARETDRKTLTTSTRTVTYSSTSNCR